MEFSEELRGFLRATESDHDEIQAEMASYAEKHDFPIVGPETGDLLRLVANVTGARRIFEFGSGFGYSASWFLRGMPDGGEIVLTEVDADELEMAEEFFERGGAADRLAFEHGDAMEIVERYDGPFDVVLIDHLNRQYADAFEAIREKLPVGSVVVADNVMTEPVVRYFGGDGTLPEDASPRGLVEYIEHVRSDPAFNTVILPIGRGLVVTTRERDDI